MKETDPFEFMQLAKIHIIYEELKNGQSKKNGRTNLELIRSQCMQVR